MIKLGAQHKDQVKVDSLANTINNSKLELELIETEKSSKEKELNDVINQLDFATQDLTQRQDATNMVIEYNLSKIDELNTEVLNLETLKIELENKVKEITDSFEIEKTKVSSDIKDFEKVESKKLTTLNVEVAALESRKTELEDFIQVMSVDLTSNSITVDNLKEEIEKLEYELLLKRNEHNELSSSFDDVSSTHEELSNDVTSLQADMTNLNEIINSLSSEITSLQNVKSTLQDEVDSLNEKKEEFAREKLAFQSNKELILLKEQFIIEKYNLAGVPYK